MGEIHEFLKKHGRQAALASDLAAADVKAAVAFMTDERLGRSLSYSGLCNVFLPHKAIAPESVWLVDTDLCTLMVEPGRRIIGGRNTESVGVPYGSRARLILLYLQTRALQTQSREIELGGCMREWLGKLGVPISGPNYRSVQDQAERISRCKVSFHWSGKGGVQEFYQQGLVDGAMLVPDEDGQTGTNLQRTRLSEGFYAALMEHAVPVPEAALRAISNNSGALDCYLWLAYRLHKLHGPVTVPWPSLHQQFGTNYVNLDDFRKRFRAILGQALAVYPAAKLDVETDCVRLHPSRPPVSEKNNVAVLSQK